jgi:uncharacterized membrane protein YkoI
MSALEIVQRLDNSDHYFLIKVELENEDCNVVYGVEIKTANGESDVKVDAGDGRVLHVEKDGEDN